MNTLFDLRVRKESAWIEAVRKTIGEPLDVVSFDERSINACMGCWDCWLRTPGRCVMNDPMSRSYPAYMSSNRIVLLMDTAQGFISHRSKAFMDRTIPHYHAYIAIVDGECRHAARYSRYPDLVFVFDKRGLSDREDELIEAYLARSAAHYRSKAYRLDPDGGGGLRLLKPARVPERSEAGDPAGSMERLVIYNGSPRRKNSNSGLILDRVVNALGDRVEIRDLKKREHWDRWAEGFSSESHVLFFMPLYVHAMPSHVMAFMERLPASEGTISFFVQSGFPESSQSHYLEAYAGLLARRLGRTYLGTAIRGGVESLQMRPPEGRDAMMAPMVGAIVRLADEGRFHPEDLERLARPVRFGRTTALLAGLLFRLGTNRFIWGPRLKQNNAFAARSDRPYAPRKGFAGQPADEWRG